MHGPCVKITKAFSTGIDDYFCPRCKPGTTLISRGNSDPTQLGAKATTPSQDNKQTMLVVQTSKLLELSDEILLWILTFVRCQKSICRVSSTCKRFWRVAQDPYLWKHITLEYDAKLRQHWDTLLQPRLLKADIFELNLLGEISAPDALNIDLFTGLEILRLEDVQAYTVYRLAGKLHWLKIFEARKIKGNSDTWDWRPFQNLNQLEELLLWRNEKPHQTFSLSQEISDDIYPQGEELWGGFVHLANPVAPDSAAESDNENDDSVSIHSSQSLGWSDDSHQSGQSQRRQKMMPKLRRLALINIVSPTTHRGTDVVMRDLVSRVNTFIYWNSFNILFPVVRTSYEQLTHLTLIEPCEPAWHEGTWHEHATAFQRMKRLESVTLINANMSRNYLIPIIVSLLSQQKLKRVQLISTDGIEIIKIIFSHILDIQWLGQLVILIQDDLGADPVSRDWCVRAKERVAEENGRRAASQGLLDFEVKLFRSEWDEDAGLKRLCLKAWQQTL
ncbi:hypothetical protein BGZ76_011061 [Entomortierella beljakovae]|nr:hypothetical protein BGZ76_011061 [Entomortierella beljakovae]